MFFGVCRKLTTVRGIITVVDWDRAGSAAHVALLTTDGKKFLIDDTKTSPKTGIKGGEDYRQNFKKPEGFNVITVHDCAVIGPK